MKLPERLPRETGRDYALRVLKENIVNLEIAPGSQISENELSAEMLTAALNGSGYRVLKVTCEPYEKKGFFRKK